MTVAYSISLLNDTVAKWSKQSAVAKWSKQSAVDQKSQVQILPLASQVKCSFTSPSLE